MKLVRRISLIALCWACLWAASTAAPAAKELQAPTVQQIQEQLDAQKKAADELKADNKELLDRLKAQESALLDRLKAQESALLETQRKSIDWWLSAIGIGLTILGLVIAVGGVLLPLYWQRSERRRLGEAQAEFARMNSEANGLLDSLKAHAADGAKAAADATQHAEDSKKTAEDLNRLREMVQSFESVPIKTADALPADSAQDQALVADNAVAAEAAQQLAGQAEATEVDKLRARAIAAAQMDNPSDEKAREIYGLWSALTIINPEDSGAQFNSGYWAQELYKRDALPGRQHWFDALGKHYSQRLLLGKNGHAAAYNWGNALKNEAQAIREKDLDTARALWKAAGEKYELALNIKKDKHEAANNWGLALANEAQAIREKDLDTARALWKAAGEKYELALAIKPDMHEAAYNWGLALAYEAQAIREKDLDAARALWKAAGEKYALALDIKKDNHEAASNWGSALDDEAQAINEKDLDAARALWKTAGEKYALALDIKKDNHEAASNWGSALIHEFHALSADAEVDRKQLLGQAEALLSKHASMDEGGRMKCSYNLACVYSLQGNVIKAVEQLEICRVANELPSHWRTDDDFALIRSTPEYQAWVQQHKDTE
ncbi:hypothetical protein KIK84_09960 [Curvibacter sp. CHRR-16]|uniref:TPR end-of-group domain-containing protein n=1 Tax=Curvibacter sp. CHRR-16 TaxID=2835872 RepID=UPI001BD9B684|nr:hypothetical protein [Curvibacter sp. CHRR-16]MBT0570653.1 hypothetical protein [Curvibacter sp. CHRR-16]